MPSAFQLVEKVCFFKKSACSQSLSPLGHSVGFASCKAWCVLISASLPKTPSPWEGAILLGLPPLDPVGGYAPATPFSENTKVYRQSERQSCGSAFRYSICFTFYFFCLFCNCCNYYSPCTPNSRRSNRRFL